MQCHQKYSKVLFKGSKGFYFSNVLRWRFLWLFTVVKVMHKFKVFEWQAYLILICASCCFIIHCVAYFLFYIFSSDSRWNIDFLTLQIITWCMTAAKTYPTSFRVQISSSWFAIHLHYFAEHFLLFFMKFGNQFLKAHGSFNIVVGYCFTQYYLPQQEHFIWSLQCFLLGIHW